MTAHPPIEDLIEDYCVNGLSLSALAERHNLDRDETERLLREAQVAIREGVHDIASEAWLATRCSEGMSVADIADSLGISEQETETLLARYGLHPERRFNPDRVLNDPGWLHEQYVTFGLSTAAIATTLNVNPGRVIASLEKAGIRIRPGIEDVASGPWLNARRSEGMSIHDISALLNCGTGTVITLLDRYGLHVDSAFEALRSPRMSKFAHLFEHVKPSPEPRRKNGGKSIQLDNEKLVHAYVVEERNVEEIASEYGVSKNTILSRLRQEGVEIRPRGPVPRKRKK